MIKFQRIPKAWIILFILSLGWGDGAMAANMGTAFTYQGRLLNSAVPVTGSQAMTFRLYDALTGGTQIGTDQSVTAAVTNGLFNVTLDFGTDVFNGQARWLEIVVGSTPLSPRQPLTPSPYALALPGLWTQQNATSPNLIGGYQLNAIKPGVVGATISGGGHSGFLNEVNGNYGNVGGGNKNRVECQESTIGGGTSNHITVKQSVIAGGRDNRVGGASVDCTVFGESTIGGGLGNVVIGQRATVAGGNGNTAEADLAFVGGGVTNHASGISSTVAGGESNRASGSHATIPGGKLALASHYGEMAYAIGNFNTQGDAQSSLYVLRGVTNNATTEALNLGKDGGTVEVITLAPDRTLAFEILVSARAETSGNSAGYRITGVIKNVAGTTTMVGTPVTTVLGEDVAGWNAFANANDGNDSLEVGVTGAAATTIRWVATARTTEVSFPPSP